MRPSTTTNMHNGASRCYLASAPVDFTSPCFFTFTFCQLGSCLPYSSSSDVNGIFSRDEKETWERQYTIGTPRCKTKGMPERSIKKGTKQEKKCKRRKPSKQANPAQIHCTGRKAAAVRLTGATAVCIQIVLIVNTFTVHGQYRSPVCH